MAVICAVPAQASLLPVHGTWLSFLLKTLIIRTTLSGSPGYASTAYLSNTQLPCNQVLSSQKL